MPGDNVDMKIELITPIAMERACVSLSVKVAVPLVPASLLSEEEAKKIGKVDFLAQGTIYPGCVESGLGGESTVIKSHHNVGGLPDYVDFKEMVEPLRQLFKDEVRSSAVSWACRSIWSASAVPRPGSGHPHHRRSDPGKAGHPAGCRRHLPRGDRQGWVWTDHQPVLRSRLTNMRSVGVMGDERTYDYTLCAAQRVTTTDFMTANWKVLMQCNISESQKAL